MRTRLHRQSYLLRQFGQPVVADMDIAPAPVAIERRQDIGTRIVELVVPALNGAVNRVISRSKAVFGAILIIAENAGNLSQKTKEPPV
jgi:hypothetical protein